MIPAKCPICNDTGLVPSKALGVFSGKPIPNCFSRCECNPEEEERYHPVKPSDYDYPVSYSYWRSLCKYHGWPDPGSVEAPEPEKEIKPVFRPRPIDKEIDQLKGGFIHLQTALNQHIDASKKRTLQVRSNKKGIRID